MSLAAIPWFDAAGNDKAELATAATVGYIQASA
jgi:hypothetical protein